MKPSGKRVMALFEKSLVDIRVLLGRWRESNITYNILNGIYRNHSPETRNSIALPYADSSVGLRSSRVSYFGNGPSTFCTQSNA